MTATDKRIIRYFMTIPEAIARVVPTFQTPEQANRAARETVPQ